MQALQGEGDKVASEKKQGDIESYASDLILATTMNPEVRDQRRNVREKLRLAGIDKEIMPSCSFQVQEGSTAPRLPTNGARSEKNSIKISSVMGKSSQSSSLSNPNAMTTVFWRDSSAVLLSQVPRVT